MRGELEPGHTCPRCGAPISWVEKRVRRGQLYYYAVHVVGRVEGKRRVKKCYLGPERYIYVEETTNPLALRHMLDPERFIDYIEEATRTYMGGLETEGLEPEAIRKRLEKAGRLKQALTRLIGEIEGYIRGLEAELARTKTEA